MIIKAVIFRKEGFYTQPMVFGGEEGPENMCAVYADMFMIRTNMTGLLLKTYRKTGNVRDANSPGRSLTRLKNSKNNSCFA